MKNLVDILRENILRENILEKLRVDDVNPLPLEFPLNGTMAEVVEFLKMHGFYEHRYHGWSSTRELFDRQKRKIFYVEDETINFADTSREAISNDNMIFVMDVTNRGNDFYMGAESIYRVEPEEFLDQLNKQFHWK